MANTLFLLSLVVIWVMLLYHMFLMLGGYLHFTRFERVIPQWKKKLTDLPTVSILIPAHNEAVVIEKTLRAMIRLEYPKDRLEVVVINDNSTDKTGEIARKIAMDHPFIKVVDTMPPRAGKGKSSALNQGFEISTGKYIIVYDADNTPEKKAVYYLVMGLENDQKAGAIVGKFRVSNAKRTLLTRFINIETICFQWMAQAGRWFWFKMTTIPGTNFAIRRSIIETLGGWDEQALAEDTELSIRVYNLGYSIRFFPAAITWEQEPETWKVWWRQRTRWARGNQYVVVKFMRTFLSLERKIVAFDLIYFFFTYFLFFSGVIVSNIIFITNLFIDLQLTIGLVSIILWVLAYFLYVTEVFITLSIEQTEMTLTNFFIVLLMYFTYSQLWIILVAYSLILEIKRALLRQEVQWYKTERFDSES
ncbi:glycosyltransferase [Ammoniphilus oxalaticus]|uniref:Glycosyltransferase n=1 Tax=Ammoniphilus oxalaticus TaxID=66863 RepID=A0A419SNN0_9BACL|nr:glycosyltransferase [Ammoniphilus oxalaticus]RKD25898.1 glycosyltransferase [Ammoniphilus oxalaticus]